MAVRPSESFLQKLILIIVGGVVAFVLLFNFKQNYVKEIFPATENEETTAAPDCKIMPSEKLRLHPNFVQVYESVLCKYRDDEFTMLEIGTGGYARGTKGGLALDMWRTYFPKATIYSLDLVAKKLEVPENVFLLTGSQTDETVLAEICEFKQLKLIIDDGSHRSADIIKTFESLFGCLEMDGIYAIEDTQTSYFPNWGGSCDLNDPSTSVNYFKSLADQLNYIEIKVNNKEFTPHKFANLITGIHFYRNIIVVEKGTNNVKSNMRYKPEMDCGVKLKSGDAAE